MRARHDPLVQSVAAVQYPEPDWTGTATVAELFVPAETVGWIILQGSALRLLSALAPDALGAPIREEAERLIREGALDGRGAADVFADVVALAPHLGPSERDLPAVLEQIRTAWGV
jgi:hypothetical protein